MAKPKSTKFRPDLKPSLIKQTLQESKSISDIDLNTFVVTFRHFDKTQGDSFADWESKKILAHAIEVIAGYCQESIASQIRNKKFKTYLGFPPPDKTIFKYPPQVPEDALWARIHITGTQIVAGHVYQNTFFVVFLTDDHDFWRSSKN